jgi:hypothetical protein
VTTSRRAARQAHNDVALNDDNHPVVDRDRVLWVDPLVHAGEVDRFWAKVVKGPGERDCWIWTGAIADDGYGRYSIRRGGRERIVRPHRYAAAVVQGVVLGPDDVVEHEVCAPS